MTCMHYKEWQRYNYDYKEQQRKRDDFDDVTHKSLQAASRDFLSLARSDWSTRERLCMN